MFFTQTLKASHPMNENESTLLTRLRALPRPAWVLFFGTFLNKFGTFVIPFLALYMTRRGFTLGNAGVAIGAYGAGNLFASIIGGHLADTIGRRKTITLSMFSGAASMLLLSQADSLFGIIAIAFLCGLTAELYRPASSALLADLVPPGQRVTAFSAYRMAFNAGWAFGPATAGFLAERSYFWLFVGDAGTSFLFGVVAWFALPHGLRSQEKKAGWPVVLKRLICDKPFLRMLAASMTIAVVFMQMSSTFGLHVTQQGLSSATYGALISLNGVIVVLCELPLTTITQRCPARRMMALGYLLIGFGFALNAFAHTVTVLTVSICIFTLGEMISMPVASAFIADLSPPEMRGRYMGAWGFNWALTMTWGPALGMYCFSLNPTAFWLVCGVLGTIAAALALSTPKPLRESA